MKSSGIEEALLLKPKNHPITNLGDNTSVCGFVFTTGADEQELKAKLDAAREATQVIVNPEKLEPSH